MPVYPPGWQPGSGLPGVPGSVPFLPAVTTTAVLPVYPAGGFSVATGSITDTFSPSVPTSTGDLLILFVGDAGSNAINAVAVNDTKGNIWRKGPAVQSGAVLPTSAWIAARAAQLLPTDVITVTWDTASSFGKSGSLAGVRATVITNPDVDYLASASATGSSTTPSVTSGTPNYPAEFPVGVLNTGFAGANPAPSGANLPLGLVFHNDATNWLQATRAPNQGAGTVAVTGTIASAAWSALVVMVAPNLQVAPVYPAKGPVRARTPLAPRTGAGQTATRTGPYGNLGPPVKPLPGPVKGRPAVPFLSGRHESRTGAAGILGPPVRVWHGPVKGQPGVPYRNGRTTSRSGPVEPVGPPVRIWQGPVRAKIPPGRTLGRAQGRAGPYGGLGPPVKPLSGPVRGQPAKPFLKGRTEGRAGTLGVTGPPLRPPSGPVTPRRPGPFRSGRTEGRTGPLGLLGPPARTWHWPFRSTTMAPPRRGRTQTVILPPVATVPPVVNFPGSVAITSSAPIVIISSGLSQQVVITSALVQVVISSRLAGSVTITQAAPSVTIRSAI